MTNRPYIDFIEFEKSLMIVRVDVVGHPTQALEVARTAIAAILSGHGAWCITQIHGGMDSDAQYPSDFKTRVEAERTE